MNVTIVDGDLLDQDVDVIVNAWNRNIIPWWLLIPQGVSGAIKKRGGLQPFRELGRMGAIPLGHAVETSAGTSMSLASTCCGDHRSAQFVIRYETQFRLPKTVAINR
jgi:O-acetyl-ADP-ribose deacetylase (regulator of RNase III)